MYLGIDLGTSNSAVVGNQEGQLKLFKTSDGRDVLPSVLYVDRRGARYVGSRAYEQLQLAPQNCGQGFKRLMGTDSRLTIAGQAMPPEECSAEVIRALLSQVRAAVGDADIRGTVITIPAAFNQMQSEATIRAATAAGLEQVGLIQEPVAAGMAALEGRARRDGRFLVYDLGGGTFDVALVQATGGEVTVLAHEGINMLGGRDFDRVILDSIVRPWLVQHYRLPPNPESDPAYKRLLAIARYRSEQAKIELSDRDEATVFVSDEDARAEDLDGEPIYIDVTVTRPQLEALISDYIDDSIVQCRKLLEREKLSHEDIDRIVLIGGPSKMPIIRQRVPAALGIPADLDTDPMTAVARGAAIFAESRNWQGTRSSRKSARERRQATKVELTVTYSARVTEERGRIRIAIGPDVAAKDLRLRITGSGGHDSGEIPLAGNHDELVVLPTVGQHSFDVLVRDAGGVEVYREAIAITRVHATTAAAKATSTVAVKIVSGPATARVNRLSPIVKRERELPAKGTAQFRTTRALEGGKEGHVDIELFNQVEGVEDPELNLMIGAFRIDGSDLEIGQIAPSGTPLDIHWTMDDNGLMRCDVELPDVGIRLQQHSYYVPQVGHQIFDGEEGGAIANAAVERTAELIESTKVALGDAAATDLARLERRLDRQRDLMNGSSDAEARRAVVEEARLIAQEVARLRAQPKHRKAALLAEIDDLEERIADSAEHCEPEELERAQTLSQNAKDAVARENWDRARDLIEALRAISRQALFNDPAWWIYWLDRFSNERFAAIDKGLHDRLSKDAARAVSDGDFDGIKRVTLALMENRVSSATGTQDVAILAHLAGR
jgi:molecular chaperone DnaK